MKEDKPNSFDIAYLAGVSQSTVSRALSGSPLVNLKTRQKIEAIAKQLNYQVDQNASRFRSKQTKTIALLLCQDPGWGDSQINPFFLSMLSSIAHSASSQGYDLLLSFQQLSEDWTAEFESAHRADGIILLGYGNHVHYQQKLHHLNQSGAHFVCWGPELEQSPNCCSVGCDNTAGAYDMTRHLLGLERKHIAFLGSTSRQCPEFAQRYEGHVLALTAAGIYADTQLQLDVTDSSEDAGYAAVMELAQNDTVFDAIFAASDLIALGAMQALRKLDRSVPGDVAVVGFDDIPIAPYASPPLTTMRQNTVAGGRLLVENLLNIINGNPTDSVLIPTQLIQRSSCGAS